MTRSEIPHSPAVRPVKAFFPSGLVVMSCGILRENFIVGYVVVVVVGEPCFGVCVCVCVLGRRG